MTKKAKKRRILSCIGAAAGLINGLFGAAGGILAVEGLRRNEEDDRRAHATSTVVILPLCIVSAAVYFLNGRLDAGLTLKTAVGAAAGGFLGGKLLGKINEKWLDIVYMGIVLAAGIRMLAG